MSSHFFLYKSTQNIKLILQLAYNQMEDAPEMSFHFLFSQEKRSGRYHTLLQMKTRGSATYERRWAMESESRGKTVG